MLRYVCALLVLPLFACGGSSVDPTPSPTATQPVASIQTTEPTRTPEPTPKLTVDEAAPELAGALSVAAAVRSAPVSASFGPAGGEMELSDGTIVTVPPGVFPADVDLSATILELDSAEDGRAALLYRIGTERELGALREPIVVALPEAPSPANVLRYVEGEGWRLTHVFSDSAVRFEIDHLSYNASVVQWCTYVSSQAPEVGLAAFLFCVQSLAPDFCVEPGLLAHAEETLAPGNVEALNGITESANRAVVFAAENVGVCKQEEPENSGVTESDGDSDVPASDGDDQSGGEPEGSDDPPDGPDVQDPPEEQDDDPDPGDSDPPEVDLSWIPGVVDSWEVDLREQGATPTQATQLVAPAAACLEAEANAGRSKEQAIEACVDKILPLPEPEVVDFAGTFTGAACPGSAPPRYSVTLAQDGSAVTGTLSFHACGSEPNQGVGRVTYQVSGTATAEPSIVLNGVLQPGGAGQLPGLVGGLPSTFTLTQSGTLTPDYGTQFAP